MGNLWPLEAEESCSSCAVVWEEWFTSENRSFRWFSEYLVVFPEASASTSRVTQTSFNTVDLTVIDQGVY